MLSTTPTITTSMVVVSVLQRHIPTMVVDTPLTTTTSMEVAWVAQRQVLTMVVEQLPTTTIDMEVVLAQLQLIQVMEVATQLTTTTDTVVAQVAQRQVLTMVVGQLPTTTTSMAVVSVLLRHIPTMAEERLQPIMTFMVITSDLVPTGNKRLKRLVMKKSFLIILCMMALNANAQVYAYDSWAQLPTTDLYDTQTMNMALAHGEMAARVAARKQALFEQYTDQAIDAFRNNQWNNVIYYVNQALGTTYYNGDIYYLRGYAFEQLGDLKQAKKDYRKGKKYGSYQASSALESLKARKRKK